MLAGRWYKSVRIRTGPDQHKPIKKQRKELRRKREKEGRGREGDGEGGREKWSEKTLAVVTGGPWACSKGH